MRGFWGLPQQAAGAMLWGSQVCSALRRLCRLGLALWATPPQR
ncbi:hypothetical protein SGRA_1254 [Saprospira grandis str. Lewin]|uniref:Uncharacterized protein n=1 Tax=Saprospira grandis (strain Lewin) TaxID=984262 RepID=H6L575_SAPGL|nr:hypothetical protein SGRA_1254 [Saprospira grandis str. Lewin]